MRAAWLLSGALGLFLLSAACLTAQVVLHNPSIPRAETMVYLERIGSTTRRLTQTMRLHSDPAGGWYEFRSHSPDLDLTIRLDAQTLFASSSDLVSRGTTGVVHRTSEIVQTSMAPKPGELLVGDPESLPVALRGLPWGTFSTVRLITPQPSERGVPFVLQLTVTGKETIQAGGRRYACWKVQLALDGWLGSFMGKSVFWFTEAAPHYLVRSERPTGGPGSPTRVLELQSYAAEK